MIHPMLADFGLRFVFVVLLLSGLSFLGLGVQPPDADLGSLVRENISGLAEGAPAVIAPALAIATLTIGVNLLIDSLRRPRRAARRRRALTMSDLGGSLRAVNVLARDAPAMNGRSSRTSASRFRAARCSRSSANRVRGRRRSRSR